jgi:hypothetical protein
MRQDSVYTKMRGARSCLTGERGLLESIRMLVTYFMLELNHVLCRWLGKLNAGCSRTVKSPKPIVFLSVPCSMYISPRN